MVDHTTKQSSGGWGAGLWLAAAFIIAMLLYGIFAGGGPSTADPASLGAAPAVDAAPAISE